MKGGDFYIISGPVFMPNYRVIGNGVGVPDYLYKIIVERTSGQVMAYLIPNAPLPVSDLPKYQTTISAVESATGIQFNLGK
jgi:DNA/RNA endonuclease G (NUC1)